MLSAKDRSITRYQVSRSLREWGLVAFSVLGIIIIVAPLVWMALSGLKSRDDVIRVPIEVLPRIWYFSNYSDIFKVTPLASGMLNSAFTGALICITTVALSTILD